MNHHSSPNKMDPLARLLPAFPAGICAALTLLLVTMLAPHHSTIPNSLRAIAHTALGGAQISSKNALLLGAALHLAVSIGWAMGYAFLATQNDILMRRPWISGTAFGVIVYLIMCGVLVMINAFLPPQPTQLVVDLLAHTVGFGIPVALVIAKLAPLSPTADTA